MTLQAGDVAPKDPVPELREDRAAAGSGLETQAGVGETEGVAVWGEDLGFTFRGCLEKMEVDQDVSKRMSFKMITSMFLKVI